jgi:hypothetical protein
MMPEHHRETWHQHRDARTTRFHVRIMPFVREAKTRCGTLRPSHSVANVHDDRERPSEATERADDKADLGEAPNDLCFSEGVDRVFGTEAICPTGQLCSAGHSLLRLCDHYVSI